MQELEIYIDSFSQPFFPRNYSTETDKDALNNQKTQDVRTISCNKFTDDNNNTKKKSCYWRS